MIAPDEVQAWLILATSTGTAILAAGTLAYSRVHHLRLDTEALDAIHRQNLAAIRIGQPAPFPEWLPHDHDHAGPGPSG